MRSAVRSALEERAARFQQRQRQPRQRLAVADAPPLSPALDRDAVLTDLFAYCLEHPESELAPRTVESYAYYAARLSAVRLRHREPAGTGDEDLASHVYLGDVRARDLIALDVEAMHQHVGKAEGHPTTANRLLAFLKICCRRAEKIPVRQADDAHDNHGIRSLRATATNPCKAVKPFKEVEKTDHLREEHRGRFVDSLHDLLASGDITRQVWGLFLLMLFTGLRKSDALALRWAEVRNLDKDEPYLHVMARGPKKRASKGGEHQIYLGPAAAELLRKMPRVCEFVFPNPRTRKPYVNIQKPARRIYERAGVPFKGTGVHPLRHTAATALMEADVPVLLIKQQMGWSSLACLQRYTHGGKRTGLRAATELESRILVSSNDHALQHTSTVAPGSLPPPDTQHVPARLQGLTWVPVE